MTRSHRASEPRVVVLEGDPAQIGLAHGQLLGREIHTLLQQLEHHIFRKLGPIQGTSLRIAAGALSLAMHRHIPTELKAEMGAIAQGSGTPYSDLLLLNTLDDVLNILRRLTPRTPKLGCSSFALLGARSWDGSLLHGRNLDYHFRGTPLEDHGAVARIMAARSILFVHRPRGRAAFVSVGWPGLVGVTTAINEEALSLGNLTSYLRSATPNGTPSAILYRRMMEETSSISEAGALLRSARRTMGNNLMVGSGRENSAALFEITPGVVVEVPPEDGALVATNHFLSPALAARQQPYLQPHSVARWKRLRALCNRYRVTLKEALTFLADTGYEEEYATLASARVANQGTAVSVLFQPAEMRLWLGMAEKPPTSQEYRAIDARALLTQRPEGRLEITPGSPKPRT